MGVESLRKATKNAVGIAGVLTESRARHLPQINLLRYFEVRLVGNGMLPTPRHAPSCSLVPSTSSCSVLFCCLHSFMLRPVLLFRPRLRARSCSPVRFTSSYSVLFSCYIHLFMPRPALLLHLFMLLPVLLLHTSSCSVLCSCSIHVFVLGPVLLLMHFFVLRPVLLLHAPVHAPPCSPVTYTS